jgi:hypothetical protein
MIAGSGQQLRQDDPSALKEIIGLVKQKMQGVDPSSMKFVSVRLHAFPHVLISRFASSRTRFMLDALTNLKNNKTKPDANGAVDNYGSLKKFLSGLKKRSGRSSRPCCSPAHPDADLFSLPRRLHPRTPPSFPCRHPVERDEGQVVDRGGGMGRRSSSRRSAGRSSDEGHSI